MKNIVVIRSHTNYYQKSTHATYNVEYSTQLSNASYIQTITPKLLENYSLLCHFHIIALLRHFHLASFKLLRCDGCDQWKGQRFSSWPFNRRSSFQPSLTGDGERPQTTQSNTLLSFNVSPGRCTFRNPVQFL